jgi:hypothetical protein
MPMAEFTNRYASIASDGQHQDSLEGILGEMEELNENYLSTRVPMPWVSDENLGQQACRPSAQESHSYPFSQPYAYSET